MKKKRTCLLLAMLLIVGILPMAALADGSTAFAVGTVSGLPGAEVELPVTISGSAFAAFTIEISYPGVLTFKGISFGNAQIVDSVEGQDTSDITNGLYAINGNRITYVNGASVSGGTLTLKFAINDEGKAGDYDVSITVTEIRDIDEQSLGSAVTPGKVTVTEAPAEPDYILGDVNGDGNVNSRDVRVLYQYTSRQIDAYAALRAAGDVNGDGNVNSRDVRVLYQYTSKQISEFPITVD